MKKTLSPGIILLLLVNPSNAQTQKLNNAFAASFGIVADSKGNLFAPRGGIGGVATLEIGLAIDDRGVRSKLASWAVKSNGLKYTSYRAISALSKGERPGPENSIGKMVGAPLRHQGRVQPA